MFEPTAALRPAKSPGFDTNAESPGFSANHAPTRPIRRSGKTRHVMKRRVKNLCAILVAPLFLPMLIIRALRKRYRLGPGNGFAGLFLQRGKEVSARPSIHNSNPDSRPC